MIRKNVLISENNQKFLDDYELNGLLSRIIREYLNKFEIEMKQDDKNGKQKTKRR